MPKRRRAVSGIGKDHNALNTLLWQAIFSGPFLFNEARQSATAFPGLPRRAEFSFGSVVGDDDTRPRHFRHDEAAGQDAYSLLDLFDCQARISQNQAS